MAQAWESEEIKRQGDLYTAARLKGDTAGMQAASAEANRLRTPMGYQTNASGLNQAALPGWQADSTNTKFTQIQQPSPQQNYVQDNSGLINQQYDSALSALKAQIQQSINNKNTQIAGLGQKYQPMKNQSEVQRYSNLRSVLEQNANAGDRGGVGRQESLQTQTAADNRLNDIGLQQTNEETSLRNDISNLLLEGNIQEAQITAQKLKDLIANNQYVDQTNYSRMRDTVADTGRLSNGTYTQTGLMNKLNIDEQQLKNAALPQQIKDQATLLQQNIQKGDIDIATGQAQLKELTNPNSVTNQLAKLNLDTAKFNYSQLSVEAQQKAAMVANDLANGRMNRAQAQASIDNLNTNRKQTEWENSNIQKGLNPDGTAKVSDAYKNYLSMGTDMRNTGSEYQGTFTPRYSNEQIVEWVKGLSLTPAEKAKLANDLGLQR